MKKLMLLAAFAGSSIFSIAQSQKIIDDKNAQTRSVKGFHAIKVSHGIDLFISQGNEEAVAVSASDIESRDKIKTVVEDGVLRIYIEKGSHMSNWGNKKLRAYVSFTSLTNLGASGGSDVFAESGLKLSKLDIDLSGGSDLKGKVDIGSLYINQSGGSDVHVTGHVSNLKIDASGGSDLDSYDLETDICDIVASGGSDVHITVNKELTADASGGSDIYYRGNGVIKSVKSSGESSVTRKS